jgi:hypothetical protein
MREHPAARQQKPSARNESANVEIKNSTKSLPSLVKNKPKEHDGKLSELPEFLVYVYKTRKYDML